VRGFFKFSERKEEKDVGLFRKPSMRSWACTCSTDLLSFKREMGGKWEWLGKLKKAVPMELVKLERPSIRSPTLARMFVHRGRVEKELLALPSGGRLKKNRFPDWGRCGEKEDGKRVFPT